MKVLPCELRRTIDGFFLQVFNVYPAERWACLKLNGTTKEKWVEKNSQFMQILDTFYQTDVDLWRKLCAVGRRTTTDWRRIFVKCAKTVDFRSIEFPFYP